MNNMKRIIKSLVVGCSLLCASLLSAATLSSFVYTNGVFTNFPSLPAGPLQVKQVILANPSTNTVTMYLYDVNTNSLVVTNAAYTNTVSYLTNYITTFTNYYGSASPLLTNTALFDNTNNAVAAGTNTIPPKLVLVALPNTTLAVQGVSYYFYSGVWVTNASPYGAGTNGNPVLTLTCQ